jgi:hypothetical protein
MAPFDQGDWVELQLTANGQTTAGRYLTSYYGDGGVRSDYLIPSNPPNTQSQRTFLITNGSTVDGGVTPDLNAGLLGPAPGGFDPTGQDGAVCITEAPPDRTPVDCVSYGNFTGNIPSAGTPAPATAFGQTLERKITPACATALDDADDTNNSAADFAISMNTPRNNSATPTETTCQGPGVSPNTKIDKAPKNKVKTRKKKAKVKYKFSSDIANSTFQCKLDDAAFAPCTPPLKLKVKKGKHSFEVQATAPTGIADQSPATDDFKVKRTKKHH